MVGWSGPDRGPPVPELQTGDQRAPGISGSETVGGVVRAGEGSHQDLQESGQEGGGGQSSSQGQGPLLPQLLRGDTAPTQLSPPGGNPGPLEDCLFLGLYPIHPKKNLPGTRNMHNRPDFSLPVRF